MEAEKSQATKAPSPADLGCGARFFRDTLYPKVIHPGRVCILVAYAILVIVFVSFAVQIQPDRTNCVVVVAPPRPLAWVSITTGTDTCVWWWLHCS